MYYSSKPFGSSDKCAEVKNYRNSVVICVVESDGHLLLGRNVE